MIDDDFDFDQPVTRIPQHANSTKQLGNQILKQAEQYLTSMGSASHAQFVSKLRQLATQESYFDLLADQIEFESDAPIANDALNLLYFWKMASEKETELADFALLDLIEKDYFQNELLTAVDALQIGENLAQHRQVIEQCLKMYQQECYAGCVTVLYGQVEGILTEALAERGYLKLNQTKYIDVYKIVPGLKGHEVKGLWHKVKVATDINPYFMELQALKMDNSSSVTATRHNIVHGSDLGHFSRERSFVLFIWLFAMISFITTVKK